MTNTEVMMDILERDIKDGWPATRRWTFRPTNWISFNTTQSWAHVIGGITRRYLKETE